MPGPLVVGIGLGEGTLFTEDLKDYNAPLVTPQSHLCQSCISDDHSVRLICHYQELVEIFIDWIRFERRQVCVTWNCLL